MKRRELIKKTGMLTAASLLIGNKSDVFAANAERKSKPVLRIAHITDVHIRPDLDAPERFKKCLEEVKKHKIDFFLNGGDSIYDASYDTVKRERVLEQWAIWDDCIRVIKGYELHSCIGNHDNWWAAPDKSDELYGKNYVVKRLGIPNRYYSFSKSGWHFIILDGNNPSISLDDEQYNWLKSELENLPKNTPVLLMSHYPILGVTPFWEGGMHSDYKKLKTLFYEHNDKVKVCLSGHNHLLDSAAYNGTQYFCNGAMSGFWWEKGDAKSAGKCYYEETPPGYAILELYADGSMTNQYIPHSF